MTHWFEGNFREARRYLGQALANGDGGRDREILYRFGQDVASPAMTYQSIVLWCLGYFDHACSLADEAISCALATQHVPTIAYAHAHAAIFAIIQRDGRRRTRKHSAPSLRSTECRFGLRSAPTLKAGCGAVP